MPALRQTGAHARASWSARRDLYREPPAARIVRGKNAYTELVSARKVVARPERFGTANGARDFDPVVVE